MDKVFTDASFKLKPGDMSELVKTRYGYHIIKSIAHKKESYVSYDKVKDYLKDNLKKEKLGKKIKTLIDEARAKHNVKVFLKTPIAAPEAPISSSAPVTL